MSAGQQQQQHRQQDAAREDQEQLAPGPSSSGPGPGLAAVKRVTAQGAAGAQQVVRTMRAHPQERDEIMQWLQQHRGNSFVQLVVQQQGQVERALPEGIDLKSVSASVTIPGKRKLSGDWKATVATAQPTVLTAEISQTGVRVSLSPSLHVDATWPLQNADIRSAGIDFESGKAFANVADGKGLGSGMLSIKDKLIGMITETLDKGIAGTPLARPGYQPVQDPDLAGTLNKVVRGFQSLVTEDEHEGGSAGKAKPPISERDLDNVTVGGTVVARAGGEFLQNGSGLVIGAGSSLTVNAEGDGSVGEVMSTKSAGDAANAARVRAIRLHASNMQVHAKGKPVAKIESLTLAPGGKVTIDSMQLLGKAAEAKRTEGGLAALVGIIALASGDRRTAAGAMDYAQDPKLVDGLTRGMIEKEFTESIQKMVLEHRSVVPGVDLAKVLGIG